MSRHELHVSTVPLIATFYKDLITHPINKLTYATAIDNVAARLQFGLPCALRLIRVTSSVYDQPEQEIEQVKQEF